MRKIVTHNLNTDLMLVSMKHGDYYLNFTESGEFIERLKALGFEPKTFIIDDPNKSDRVWWKQSIYYTEWRKDARK
ncbi:MAG: hypothetical protein J6V90_08475 [Treponema sp.]|nr:hypothetical protein [Treponema sp.]